MPGNHPVESLLRPAVELNTACVSFSCSALAAVGPEYLMMTPSVGYGTAVVLALNGLWWSNKGWGVIRYQRNLRKQRRFVVSAEKIPVGNEHMFVGRGFAWNELHTQRYHDTRRANVQRFVQSSPSLQWVRENEHRWRDTFLHRLTTADHFLNPFRPVPDGGGSAILHGVDMKETDIYIPLSDRRGHTLVLGTTGVGKTTLMESIVTQDIRRGEIVVIFDPKGDPGLLRCIYDECERSGRLDDFYLFHLGHPEISARYNAVGDFHRITEVASRLSSQLAGDGSSAVFREFAWRFTNIVARAVVGLGERPDYRTLYRYVNAIDDLFVEYSQFVYADDEAVLAQVSAMKEEIDHKRLPRHMVGREDDVIAWNKYFAEEGSEDEILEGLRAAFKYEKSYFDKIVASLLPLLEKLTTGNVAELLSPDYLDVDDPRPIFDWKTIVNQRAVLLCSLDGLADPSVASAVGNTMFADMVSFFGQRYKTGDDQGIELDEVPEQSPIAVHMDEFSQLMGPMFIPMINQGGAAGCFITAYTQTLSDIQAKTGDESKARQVVGNFNNLFMLRVREQNTAMLLTDALPTVLVTEITQIAGSNDSSDPDSEVDFTTRQEDRISTTREAMIDPATLTRLPRGHAFAVLKGGRLFKLRFPLIEVNRSKNFARTFGEVEQDMINKYRSNSRWWAQEGANDIRIRE